MGLLREGKRKLEKAKKRQTKKHLKEFYKIINEMDDVAMSIISNDKLKDVTKDNIEGIASEYTERKIGKYEKHILLSKLNIQ